MPRERPSGARGSIPKETLRSSARLFLTREQPLEHPKRLLVRGGQNRGMGISVHGFVPRVLCVLLRAPPVRLPFAPRAQPVVICVLILLVACLSIRPAS